MKEKLIKKALEDLSKKLILKFTEKEKLMFKLGFYRGYLACSTRRKNKKTRKNPNI